MPGTKKSTQKQKKSWNSWSSRLVFYPKVNTFKIIIGMAHDKEVSKASAILNIVKKHVDELPEPIKQRYRDIYDRLTPEERKQTRQHND